MFKVIKNPSSTHPTKRRKATAQEKEQLKKLPPTERSKTLVQWGAYDDGIYEEESEDAFESYLESVGKQ